MRHRNKVLHKALAVLISSIHTAVLLRVQMKRFYFPTNSPQRIKVQTASPPTHPFFNSRADSCTNWAALSPLPELNPCHGHCSWASCSTPHKHTPAGLVLLWFSALGFTLFLRGERCLLIPFQSPQQHKNTSQNVVLNTWVRFAGGD